MAAVTGHDGKTSGDAHRDAAVDVGPMTPDYLRRAVDLLLSQPRALVCALGDDGFRVPLPAGITVPAERCLQVPADRATMMDLVSPLDRMTVVHVWEAAQRTGLGARLVRALDDPDRVLSLTIIDARAGHGVYLGGVVPTAGTLGGDSAALPVFTSARPRSGTVVKSSSALITEIDDRFTGMLGWTADQVVGRRSLEFLHAEDHGRAISDWMDMLSSGRGFRGRVRHLCADGSWLWVELENAPNGRTEDGAVVVTTEVHDVSEEMAAVEALAQRERQFRRFTESLPLGLVQLGVAGEVQYANPCAVAMLGPIGRPGVGYGDAVLPEDRGRTQLALSRALADGDAQDLELAFRHAVTGEVRRGAVTVIPLGDSGAREGAMLCLTDVTEASRTRDELTFRATTDALTGCYNRASVTAFLDHALLTGTGGLAAVFLDLDRFKPVNDLLGHAAGDELLVHVAEQLHALVRPQDVVGRLGGDEFLLALPGAGGPEEALVVAERIAAALNAPVALSAGSVDLGVSIGVACARPDDDAKALVGRADAAMYRSKQSRSGRPELG